MTDEMMTLLGIMEKSADADLLRDMIGFAATRLADQLQPKGPKLATLMDTAERDVLA